MAKPRIPTPIHRWTALKLEHLDNYLQAYVQATKRARQRHYIDAFGGCGRCVLRENGYPVEGSPWRALDAMPPFTHYYFVEKEATLAAHLRKAILGKSIENADVYTGDCNQVLPNEILPRIPQHVPSFAFLDPQGLQLHWATVQALASHRKGRKMELLILYPYDMATARLFPLATKNQATHVTLTRFYGDEAWSEQLEESVEIGESTEQRRNRFVQFYVEKLRSLGYKYVDVFGPMCSRRRSLYHVVFASDHSVGKKIMNAVWAKTRFVPGELFYQPVKRPRS